MPFTKNSSSGFPLKSPMDTDELPWTIFHLLIMEWRKKINLQDIVRARYLVRFEYKEYPNGHPLENWKTSTFF